MRQLLGRQVPTLHLDSLRKEDRNGINNEISQAPSSRTLRLGLLTRLREKACSTMSALYLSEYCDSAAFRQH